MPTHLLHLPPPSQIWHSGKKNVGSQALKGVKAGAVGLKSMKEGVSLARDVGAITSAQQSLNTYDAIDRGEITTPADASKAGLSSQSAMKNKKVSSLFLRNRVRDNVHYCSP